MRGVYRLTDVDEANAWTIPLLLRERLQGAARSAVLAGAGADGGFDLHGLSRAPRGPLEANVAMGLTAASVALMETEITNATLAILGNRWDRGLRKYWRRELSDQSAPRWSYARIRDEALPALDLEAGKGLYLPFEVPFILPEPQFYQSPDADFYTGYGLTSEDVSLSLLPLQLKNALNPVIRWAKFSCVASPTNFTITNPGDLESRRVAFYLVAAAASGWTNPTITNDTTGEGIVVTDSTPTTSTRLAINCLPEQGTLDKSTDGGNIWVDASPSLDLQVSTQGLLMRLLPGANSFTVTSGGTVNFSLYAVWFPAFFR